MSRKVIFILSFVLMICLLHLAGNNLAFGKRAGDYRPGFLSWGIQEHEVLSYSSENIVKYPELDVSPMNKKEDYNRGNYSPGWFAFFGYQLSEIEPIYELHKWGITGTYPYSITDLIERLAFTLPGKRLRSNRSSDYEATFYLNDPSSVIKVSGVFRTDDVPRDVNLPVVFKGTFVLSNADKKGDDPRFPANPLKLLEGIVNTEITFNQSQGLIEKVLLKFRYWYEWTRPEDENQQQFNRLGQWEQVEFVKNGMLDTKNQGVLNDYITRAINLSVNAIKDAQNKNDGSWSYGSHSVGATALCVLALLSSGVKSTEEPVVKAFDYLYKQEITNIYDASLVCMACEARGIPDEEWKLAAKHEVPESFERNLSKQDRELLEKATKFILKNRAMEHPSTGIGLWDYPRAEVTTRFDNSNSQYAVLGLYSAMRCSIEIPKEVFIDIAKQFMKVQEPDGPFVNLLSEDKRRRSSRTEPVFRPSRYAIKARGWSYTIAPKRPDNVFHKNMSYAYSSMTTSGITSLTIARAALLQMNKLSNNLRVEINASLDSALAFMQLYYDITANANMHPRRSWYFYNLYGIERAGVLMQTNYFGERHWYNEGAAVLCLEQGRDGRWVGNITDTAFALLFLKRATLPVFTGR